MVTGTLRRDDGGLGRLAVSLAQVWVAGGAVDWARWFPGQRNRVDLPVYAFQRQRYWPGRRRRAVIRRVWAWRQRVIRCWARRLSCRAPAGWC